MQQQVLSSINLHNDENKTDCLSYIIKQCSYYVENFGIVVKKLLCKPWPILSKQSIRKKKKQKLQDLHTCETISTIDVISLFQSANLHQQSFTESSTQSNILITTTTKPQISRQLLESLITVIDKKMPLAQNYKDDVSLLESEAALTKSSINSSNIEFNIHAGTNAKINYGNNLSRNGLPLNITTTATTTNINNNNLLADDDLPDVVSMTSTKTSGYETVKYIKKK